VGLVVDLDDQLASFSALKWLGHSTCRNRPQNDLECVRCACNMILAFVCHMGYAKMAGRINVLFGVETLGDPRNIVLDIDAEPTIAAGKVSRYSWHYRGKHMLLPR